MATMTDKDHNSNTPQISNTTTTKRSKEEHEKLDQIWKCLLDNNSDEVDTTTTTITTTDGDVDGSAKERRKITMANAIASNNDVDLWNLRSLALSSGGFMNSDIRQIAWCKLLGLQHEQTDDDDDDGVVASNSANRKENDDETRNSPCSDSDVSTSPRTASPTCTISTKDLSVIEQDVPRSVIFRYPSMIQTKKKEREHDQNDSENQQSLWRMSTTPATTPASMEEKLVHIVQSTLTTSTKKGKQSPLHYYQGLHDVAGVVLYNLHSTHQTCNVVRRICQSHLREALRDDDFSKIMWLLRTILHPMIQYQSCRCPPEKGHHHQEDGAANLPLFLQESQVDLANCILPWVITWFTHDIHNEQIASRLVDAFIASHPLFPVYLAVSILVHPHNRQDILETECDPAMVHMTIRGLLSKLTLEQKRHDEGHAAGSEYDGSTNTVPVQDLIDDALLMMKSLPPRSLLDLASTYDISIIADDFWEIASSVSLLKAPPSWALASTSRHCLIMSNHHHKYENDEDASGDNNNNGNTHDHTKNSSRSTTTSTTTTNVKLDGGWEGTATCALLLPFTRKGKMNETPPNYDRARLASGVPMLMNMVDESQSLLYREKQDSLPTTMTEKPSGRTSSQRHCVSSSSSSTSLWNKYSDVLFTRKSFRLGLQGA